MLQFAMLRTLPKVSNVSVHFQFKSQQRFEIGEWSLPQFLLQSFRASQHYQSQCVQPLIQPQSSIVLMRPQPKFLRQYENVAELSRLRF
jgi:hypothetical protein